MADQLERARQAFRTGDNESAERVLKSLVQAEPKNADARLLLGQTYLKQDKYDQGIAAFAALLTLEPDNVEALLQLGILYRLKNRPADAVAALERGIHLAPQRADLFYHLGNVYRQTGKLDQARSAFEKAIALNPREALSYHALGTVLCRLDKAQDAIQVFWRGLQADPNNPSLRYSFGQTFESLGKVEEAIREYEAAVKIRPSWRDAVNTLGLAYLKAGQQGKAIETLTRLVNQNPKDPESLASLGSAYAELRKPNEAVALYRRALEANPSYAKASLGLEAILENSGALTDALEELKRLNKLLPENDEVAVHLGRLYFNLGHNPEAVAVIQTVLKRAPANVDALRALGSVYQKSGNAKAAKECFRRILSIDPSALAFRLDLAELHKQAQDWPQALAELKEYLSQRPEDKAARLELGRVYAASGSHDHALQVFKELAAAGGGPEVMAELSAIYQLMGDREKAVQSIDSLITMQGVRGRPEDIDELNNSLSAYESAVRVYSRDARAAWDRNLRILKDAFRLKQELASPQAAEEKREAPQPLDFSTKPKAVEEDAEQLFLDESDESLAEDDFFDGELDTSEVEEPPAEPEEPADSYLNIPDLDYRPRSDLLKNEDLYPDQDPRPRGERSQAADSLDSDLGRLSATEDQPEWLKEMDNMPPMAPPFPDYRQAEAPQPAYQQPYPQQPYPQQPYPPQPYPQQPPSYPPPQYQQPQYQQPPFFPNEPAYPPQRRDPYPPMPRGPQEPTMPRAERRPPPPDEIDIDMLESLEEEILSDQEMEDIVPEGYLDAHEGPEEQIANEAPDELMPAEPVERLFDDFEPAIDAEAPADGESEPESLGAEENPDGEPTEQDEGPMELLPPEIADAPGEEGEIALEGEPAFGDESAFGEEVPEPIELTEEDEDIFMDGNSKEPEEVIDLGGAERRAGGRRATDRQAAGPEGEEVFGLPTLRLLEYLKELAQDLPDDAKRRLPVAEADRKLDDLIGKLASTDPADLLPATVLPPEEPEPRDRRSSPRQKTLAKGQESGIQIGAAESAQVSLSEELPEPGMADPEPKAAAAAPNGKTLVKGIPVSEKTAKLIRLMKREKVHERKD